MAKTLDEPLSIPRNNVNVVTHMQKLTWKKNGLDNNADNHNTDKVLSLFM